MAGHWDEQTGEYTPSHEEVAEGMRRWEIPPGGDGLVFHWLKVQERQKYNYHQLGGVAALSPRAGGTSFRVCPQRVPGTRCHQLEGEERKPTWLVVVVLLPLLIGGPFSSPLL